VSLQAHSYLLAIALTLGLEVPVVAGLFPGQRARMALVCGLATTATHLILHFLLPQWLPARGAMLGGEALALFAEAAAYALFSRPRDAGRALLASALANALSFAAGILVFGGSGV